MTDQIYMAPLEGMTDSAFRTCYYEHFGGLDRALTPFLPIPDRVVRIPAKVFQDVSLPGQTSVPEIPQLLVSTPQAFLLAGQALEEAGYTEVNWNLGCPSRGVVHKGKGAGMMPKTGAILNLLDAVLPRLSLKISLKIRLGMNKPDEAFQLVGLLKGYPLEEIICHPRLGCMMYKGLPDWERFGELTVRTDIPLVYNGDILCLEDFLALKKQFPSVTRWMIGRGILRNPFLPEILKGERVAPQGEFDPLQEEQYRLFWEKLYEKYEAKIPLENHRISWMKGLLSSAIRGNRNENSLKKQLFRIEHTEELRNFWDQLSQ